MPPRRVRQPAPRPAAVASAHRLHAAAVHLLRSLRAVDRASGLSGPRISALSVIVFGGPLSMSALAAAEQVQPPTMTRLVRELEREQLVERVRDADDRRVLKVRATTPGDYQALMRFEQYADLTRRLQQYDEWSQDLRTT